MFGVSTAFLLLCSAHSGVPRVLPSSCNFLVFIIQSEQRWGEGILDPSLWVFFGQDLHDFSINFSVMFTMFALGPMVLLQVCNLNVRWKIGSQVLETSSLLVPCQEPGDPCES